MRPLQPVDRFGGPEASGFRGALMEMQEDFRPKTQADTVLSPDEITLQFRGAHR